MKSYENNYFFEILPFPPSLCDISQATSDDYNPRYHPGQGAEQRGPRATRAATTTLHMGSIRRRSRSQSQDLEWWDSITRKEKL